MRRTAAGAVLISLVLAGCGRPADPEAVVRAAPDRTIAAKTARVSVNVRFSPDPGQPPSAGSISGEGSVELDSGRTDLTFSVGGTASRSLLVGRTLYREVRPPAAASGKSWLKQDLASVVASTGFSGVQGLLQAQPDDPAGNLGYLRAADRVVVVGRDRVRNTPTTRYRAVVDLKKAAEGSSAEQGRVLRQLASQLGLTSLPVDVWLDDGNRVRRLDHTVDLPAAPPPEGTGRDALPRRVESSFELFDFGTQVTVTIPPAEEVAEVAEDPSGSSEDPGGSGTPSPATDALQARLLRSLPSGYLRQPDALADTGPSDFEKAVRDEDAQDGREVLTSAGFVAGYQRLWSDGGDRAVIDFVYQFGTDAGARAYFERAVGRAAEEMSGGPDASFTVPGVPDATGLRRSEPDEVAVVFVLRGPYAAQIVVQGPDAATTDLALRLAQEQYLLLA